ncbi:MAG: glutamine--fructose-6-phosphate transaminase (isomerizing) [Candidatus Paceibacterota bacterium]
MCGIIGYKGTQNTATRLIFKGLKELEYRGYDSWGIAVVVNGKIVCDKHTGKIGQAKTNLPPSTIGVGHTRWATHGVVTDNNSHPHLDCTGKLAVVHNGIIENYKNLKKSLVKKGHIFVSDTDTEIIAHLVEDCLKTKPRLQQAVAAAFRKLEGSNAIVVMEKKSREIAGARNGSPLVVGIHPDKYIIASDVTPLLNYTNKVIFLEDEEGVLLGKTPSVFSVLTGRTKKYRAQKVDWKVKDAQKKGYDHFMLKEIFEQTKTVPKTAYLNETEIIQLGNKIKKRNKVTIVGCGTAYYCALAARYLFGQVGIDARVYGAYEYLPFAAHIASSEVFIAISQSGETADTLIAARTAKENGFHIVAIVNARGSTLERMADTVLAVGSGPEIAVVSTKAFTAQLSTMYLLAQATADNYTRAKKEVAGYKKPLSSWLTKLLVNRTIAVAKLCMQKEHVFVIGKYTNYAAALECALKIKETSYVHAEAFASGELKHGVIALIERGTPCIVVADNNSVKQEVLSSAMEMKSRGGLIIGISPFRAEEFEHHIKTPDMGPLTIIPNVIASQLLGYYMAIGRGADPDKPRNLAKSVTVK